MWLSSLFLWNLALSPFVAPQLAWELEVPGEIRDVAFSAGEDCIVLTTDAGVSVLDLDGSLRWERRFESVNRWMTAERSAAPAGCAWVVALGGPEYKYVWVLSVNGSSSFFPTSGAPMAVAISNRADRIAIGTGTGHLIILDRHARLIRDRDVGDGMVAGLAFSDADTHLIVTRGRTGLYTSAGDTVWEPEMFQSLSASADLEWFLGSWEVAHGPAYGSAALMDHQGVPVWEYDGNGPRGAMAPDGSFFVVDDFACPEDQLCYGQNVVAGLRVLRPDGSSVSDRRLPTGRVLAIARDSRSFLLRSSNTDDGFVCVSREGQALWKLPAGAAIPAVRSDLGAVLLSRQEFVSRGRLSFYVRARSSRP